MSSRYAGSRPCCASATTSASGRFARSRTGIGVIRAVEDACHCPGTPRSCTMSATELQQAEERSAREAASGSRDKRAYVQAMFSTIAPRYDLLNHLLSFNVDRRWRRRAIRQLQWDRAPSGLYLDLCAGTLDVAAELSGQRGFAGRVVGADFAEPMLREGKDKV